MIKNERIATDLKKEDFYYDLPAEQIAPPSGAIIRA